MIYLINQDTINLYEDISANVKPKRILTVVQKMQDLDLKPFLGGPLYYDIIKYITTPTPGVIVWDTLTPQPYQDLFNGVTYVDRRGHTIIYEGLIATMVYFAFSRFIESDAIRFTATGPATKPHDALNPLKVSDITKLVQMQRSIANSHANEVEKYLFDNKQSFTLWRFNSKTKIARQAGPRIRGVDRNNFNSPTGGNFSGSFDYYDINGLL